MGQVHVDAQIAASAAAVWGRLGDFTSWHLWIPRIVATAMDPGAEDGAPGAVRTLTLSDASTVRERLVHKDDGHRVIAYEFPEGSPFPVTDYLARVEVEAAGDGCVVHWSSTFDAAEPVSAQVEGTFTAIYTSFLAYLAKSLAAA